MGCLLVLLLPIQSIFRGGTNPHKIMYEIFYPIIHREINTLLHRFEEMGSSPIANDAYLSPGSFRLDLLSHVTLTRHAHIMSSNDSKENQSSATRGRRNQTLCDVVQFGIFRKFRGKTKGKKENEEERIDSC